MAGLSLSYCQLIKIVLSQIGGSPLQQVYTQLSQGAKQITTGSGVIPNGLTEVTTLINTITNTINNASGIVATAQDTMEKIAQQIYQNPIGSVLDTTIDQLDVRVTRITIRQQDITTYENANGAGTASPLPPFTTIAAEKQSLTDEKADLTRLRAKLVTYKGNSDKLSGVATLSGAEAGGGCSLQDLLGSGCTPNDAVPDVDLKNLIDSIKQGDLIKAIGDKIAANTGYDAYKTALLGFESTVNGFIDSFNASINKAALRNAIQSQITQIVFNLLSGCSGEVLDLTVKPNVKTAVSKYIEVLQDQANVSPTTAVEGTYVDPNGNVTAVTSVVTSQSVTGTDVGPFDAAVAGGQSYTAIVFIPGNTSETNDTLTKDLGTGYASAEEAADFVDKIMESNEITRYTVTIKRGDTVLATYKTNM
jgi:hypothetical protein